MVSRAQFLGGTTLGVLATSMTANTASAAENGRMLIATDQGIAADGSAVNQKINKLIDSLAKQGGGTIIFPPGTYGVDSQGIELKNQVSIMGLGEATHFRPLGDWKELAGVFRIGTHTTPSTQPAYRCGIHNLSIKTAKNPSEHTDSKPNAVGILFNTSNGDKPTDPDAAHRISGITLWDLDMGIILKGKDDQGCTVSEVRGRRFLRTALQIGEKEADGGADNMFSLIDFSSANLARIDCATIEIYTANCSFSQVKAWYSKRSLSFADSVKAGAGYYIKGTRNTFNQCDAQDNGGHGFVLEYPNNSLINCIADSNGYAHNISGAANPSEAHGFHILKGARGVQLIGCQSFNRTKDQPGQQVGFWVDQDNHQVTLIGSTAANTESAAQTGDLKGSQSLIESDQIDQQ
ncbi:hypothetical protein [uncultured Rothia sp.]|uniref:hypothetical protein n=1 Tax=uncultured Rothia sp. TaxID=316088 RepID=UPI003217C174